MLRSRGLNNKINSLHERVLRITYGVRSSSFENLLKKDKSVSIHHNNSFKRRRVNSVWHGTKLVPYLGPNIWDLAPNEIKKSESLNSFKFKTKRSVPEGCPCRICKIYLGQVWFITT